MTGIEELINEVRLVFHQAANAGEHLHAEEPITMAMRAVLEFLAQNGEATVPAIARSRGVTRQHIQTQVNALLEQELVELRANPGHKRSSLVKTTQTGTRLIERVRSKERAFMSARRLRVSKSDLQTTVQTLQALRAVLEGVEK